MITLRMKAENSHSEESVSEAASSLADRNGNTRHSALHVKANLMCFYLFVMVNCRPVKASHTA